MTVTVDREEMKKHLWCPVDFLKLQEVPAVCYSFKIDFLHSVEVFEEITDLDISALLSKNPALSFLNDPAEDIYKLSDGKALDESR